MRTHAEEDAHVGEDGDAVGVCLERLEGVEGDQHREDQLADQIRHDLPIEFEVAELVLVLLALEGQGERMDAEDAIGEDVHRNVREVAGLELRDVGRVQHDLVAVGRTCCCCRRGAALL